jgi:hypothetical protein
MQTVLLIASIIGIPVGAFGLLIGGVNLKHGFRWSTPLNKVRILFWLCAGAICLFSSLWHFFSWHAIMRTSAATICFLGLCLTVSAAYCYWRSGEWIIIPSERRDQLNHRALWGVIYLFLAAIFATI